jgi:integrase
VSIALPKHQAAPGPLTPATQVSMPPWITGAPYPAWMSVDASNPLQWHLLSRNKAAQKPILDFGTILNAPGRCSLPERQHLTTIAAWIIWLMGVEGLDGSPWKSASLKSLFHYVRQATRWMIAEGFGRWDQLGEAEIIRLKQHLYHPAPSSAPVGPDSRRYSMTALRCLHAYHRLWGRMPDGLLVDPSVEDRAVIRRVHNAHRQNDPDFVDGVVSGTRSIPWPLAQSLIATAIEMVESPHLTAIISLDGAMRRFVAEKPLGQDARKTYRLARELLRDLATEDSAIASALVDYPVGGSRDVFQLQRDFLTASYIVLAIFGALRISEVAGLPLVDVIDERQDGPWLNTVIVKTSPEQDGSAVPKIVPPVARTAVKAASALTAPDRSDQEELFLSHDYDRGRTSLFTQKVASTRLNDFAKRRLGITSADWRFSNHQLRKLFVQLYVRRFDGSLDAAQQHLGHVQARMIDAYLNDPDILRMIRDEQHELASEIMSGIMAGQISAAGGGLRAWHDRAAVYKARNMTLVEIAAEVKQAVAQDGLELEPTGVGYCLSSVQTGKQATCGQTKAGMPDHGNRTNAMCLGCPNSISTTGSEANLKAEYVFHKQVADSPDAAPAMIDSSQHRCSLILQRLADLEAQAA